jgi:superfamily I DNA/RNA helicase
VARLAISKGFLADYAKLGKDVQRAVDQAVATFARDPHPGRTLERPRHIKDNRLRIMPVDGHWRGVVLAPDAKDADTDTYCLVTVLPRDKAIAYASSHRFSVNAALGVLEVRNEKALSQFQPTLEAATEPESCLFADVTDADLTRLGVDPQVLSLVRLVASESDLEALESAIPEAQYAALHALASGMTLDETLEEVIRLSSGDGTSPGQVDPDDLVAAMERAPGQITFVSGPEELQHVLSYPFAAWRAFLHPNQRQIACRPSYAGPAQVTGGPGTGKTVTLLHRAAFLAAQTNEAGQADHPRQDQAEPILVTTFAGNLADALQSQLALLIRDPGIRQQIEVLNVDRLAYRIVRQSRGTPVITDERTLRARWAQAAAQCGLTLTPAFLKNEWEQVILAQDLHTEDAYLTCQRTGRARPLSKTQRTLIWQAAQQVTAELTAAGQTTHLQLANEATHLLRMAKRPPYQHVLVDEAQDLHPSQWRLLRAAVAPGPNDLFISADPHQRVYDNRVSLSSLDISVRGRSRRLWMNYRTTQEILAWTVPLLGTEPVTGLDGEVDSLLGYQSPMHGPRPQQKVAASRDQEFSLLTERIGSWLAAGIEPHAIGVAARSASLIREAREALKAARIPSVSLNGRGSSKSVRAGTMHAMKGLEFQAVAVIGVEQGLVPDPAAVTPELEDRAAHTQDLQRERCVLFVACTRARDHLYVSATADPSDFLLPHLAPVPQPVDLEPSTFPPPGQPTPAGPLATGAEVRDGQLTIRGCAPVDGLTAALYLARAPWRPPVIVQIPPDGVVKLPPEAYEGGPLRVLLRVEAPDAVRDWPAWPDRDSYACAAPGIPFGADLEEEALSRFLAGQRDLPMRPRRVDRLWLLVHLAADLIAAGAPADLREQCGAVLRTQPGLAITGLLDAGLDSAACVGVLISTGLAAVRPVMLDDMRSAERLWSKAPAAAAVLCSRLLAGPAYPDEDPAAIVMKAAQAECGPALAAVLRGEGDPHPRSAQFGPDTERMALLAPNLEAAAVPHSLLDAPTRVAAARQLFEARRHPDLARAVLDAPSVIRSAERLVAGSPYRYARTQITARLHPEGSGGWLALPAMSASLALIARIAARSNEDCRAFDRTWRPRWIALARQAPALTTIDLVLAEALIASAERARFAKKRS